MFQGNFLPEKEFIIAVTEELNKDTTKQILKENLDIVKNALDISPYAAFKAWEEFSKEFLKNPTTQLLAITEFYNKGEGTVQTWQLMQEVEAISKDKSGVVNVAQVSQEIKNVYYSEILTRHLSQFFSVVNRKRNLSSIMKDYNNFKAESLKDLIWSKKDQKSEYKVRGQIADAFLQHLGKFHLQEMSKERALSNDFSQSDILSKEGGIRGMAMTLQEAKNRVGWYTGGDLIVVDKNNKVIANIQLKTSTKDGAAIGKINISELKNKINKIYSSLNSNNVEIAEQFFNMLKTSAIPSNIENVSTNIVEDLISSVSVEKQINIKII